MFTIQGKTALITGGTRGIGAAIATALVEAGATVMITGRAETPASVAFLAELQARRQAGGQAGGQAAAHYGDVCGAAAAAAAVAATLAAFGRLDILVHSAGGAAPGRITAIAPDDWMAAFDLHVHAVYHLFRAAHPCLAQEGGAVVLVSSVAGLRGCPGTVAYQTVKAAIPQMARALALDHGGEGIRVNAIAPGIIRTDFHAAMTDVARAHNIANRIPLHREGTPQDVASLALELIRNDFITGECFTIDGGMSMRITA